MLACGSEEQAFVHPKGSHGLISDTIPFVRNTAGAPGSPCSKGGVSRHVAASIFQNRGH